MMNESDLNQSAPLTYSFSLREIKILAKFMRDNGNQLPDGIENFVMALDKSIYDNLSIEEVKNFYS